MLQKVTLTNRSGLHLAALINRDEELPLQKLILIFGGFGSSKDSPRQASLTALFERNGYAVMRMDFRGRGESEGEVAQSTVAAGLEDSDAMIDYALSQPWVDKNNLAVYGSSYGGALALLQAARRKIFKFVICVSPVSSAQGLNTAGLPPQVISEARNYDIYAETSSLDIPILIFHGDEDEIVPYNQSLHLNKAIRTSTLMSMRGYDHFYKRGFSPVERAIEDFIKHV